MRTGKKSSKEDIAIIKGSITYLFFAIINISIRALDGVEHRFLTTNKVKVIPELRRVSVKYILISYSVTVSTNVDLLFNVEAGHEYKNKEKNSCLVVVDTTSGLEVVSHPLNQHNTFYLFSI
jgi:hypothetical protein